MSVIIRGMEMPKEGYRLILVHADGTAQTTDGETTAVPVPPHGRLIDADELAAKCNKPYRLVWLSDVENAPTIIPAELSKEET